MKALMGNQGSTFLTLQDLTQDVKNKMRVIGSRLKDRVLVHLLEMVCAKMCRKDLRG